MPEVRVPKYRHYKPKNLGLVVLDGRQIYLGKHNSPESLAEYHRLVQEWLTRGQHSVPQADEQSDSTPLVSELILSFLRFAEGHYLRPDGTPTGEIGNLVASAKPLKELYGHTLANDFGPMALRAVRDRMIAEKLSRTTINSRINRIRRMFRWATSVELIPPGIVQALETVPGLQKGRSGVKESKGIPPVDETLVEAALPFMPGPVAAMVRLQLLTGCRVGEVTIMRACDIDRSGPVWEYRPSSHKNAWRGQERVIFLGPKAQDVVRPFLDGDPAAYLFRPSHGASDGGSRPQAPKSRNGTPRRKKRSAKRTLHAFYDRRSYRQAVVRACQKAGVPIWSPLQLRHTAATRVRKTHGLEGSQVHLGHKKADVTEIYAERDFQKAKAIALDLG